MRIGNVKYKDSVFRDLFGSEERKEYALELYNALAGTSHADAGELRIASLEDVFYLGVRDDVSFVLGERLVLFEHQSTRNPNMPLRGLLYFADLYRELIAPGKRRLFGRSLVHVPRPRYVVLYNGADPCPEREVLRLSDAYEGRGPADVEVTCEVLNINPGQNPGLAAASPALAGYVRLVQLVREYNGREKDLARAIGLAIDRCIGEGCLVDYLTERREAVENYFLDYHDEQERNEIYRENYLAEGIEIGIERGIEQGIEQGIERDMRRSVASLVETMGWTPEQAMDALKIPAEQRCRIA